MTSANTVLTSRFYGAQVLQGNIKVVMSSASQNHTLQSYRTRVKVFTWRGELEMENYIVT